MEDEQERDGSWVAKQAQKILDEENEKRRPNIRLIDGDIATGLGLYAEMPGYTRNEACAIFLSLLLATKNRNGEIQYPEEIHPESFFAEELRGFAFMCQDESARWCAKWVAQYVDKETAQSMYDDFERGGPPHDTGWSPD